MHASSDIMSVNHRHRQAQQALQDKDKEIVIVNSV